MQAPHPMTVLFTHFGDQWLRGSETLLLDLLRYIDPARIRPIVWCNGIGMAEACRAQGYATHRSDFVYYFDLGSPKFNLATYRGLVREGRALVQRYSPRILHANSAAPTQWLVPVARASRLPLLTHLHIDYLRRSRYVLLLHQADMVVGVSRQVNEELLGDGMTPERTKIIYNGIDFKRLHAKPAADLRLQLGVSPGTIVIGSVGSLIHRKGYDLLLRAVAQLGGISPPHVIISGGGSELQALETLAAELGITARTHFLGYYDPTKIVDIYQSCDIFALASRADAFGLVFVEAGYFGRPVVATCVGGVPEVVLHEQTGLLARPNDPVGVAAHLARLVADPDLRRRLGDAGQRRAVDVFSAQRMASEFMTEYERLAALPRHGFGWGGALAKSSLYLRRLAG